MKSISARYHYWDLLRGMAIIFTVLQHTIIVHTTGGEYTESSLGQLFLLLGTAPTAPIFMTMMGWGLYKTRASNKETFVRGIKIFLLGYALNLFRFLLPLSFSRIFHNLPTPILFEGIRLWETLFVVDIFQFAGIAMMIGVLLKYIAKKPVFVWLGPALIISILIGAPFLWRLDSHNMYSIISVITSLLWGVSEIVFFPVFPWLVYPILGMYLSKYFHTNGTIHRKKMLITATIILVISIVLFPFFPIGDYARSGLAIHLLIISFLFYWINLWYTIDMKISHKNKIRTTVEYLGRNVPHIYVYQWLLFGWSMTVIGTNRYSAAVSLLIGLGVLFLSVLFSRFKILKMISK